MYVLESILFESEKACRRSWGCFLKDQVDAGYHPCRFTCEAIGKIRRGPFGDSSKSGTILTVKWCSPHLKLNLLKFHKVAVRLHLKLGTVRQFLSERYELASAVHHHHEFSAFLAKQTVLSL